MCVCMYMDIHTQWNIIQNIKKNKTHYLQENGSIITLSKIMLHSDKYHVFSLIHVGCKCLYFFKDVNIEEILNTKVLMRRKDVFAIVCFV